jgi:hypothetical protein
LSRTGVRAIVERLWAEYGGLPSRDLSEFALIYVFVEGLAEGLRLGQAARR